MRPGSLESIRGVQAAIAGAIVPQLTSAYAQDTAATLQMLIESVAAEWDSLAEELTDDNARMLEVLGRAVDELQPFAKGNETITALVKKVEEPAGGSGATSLRISDLTAENERLRGKLEQLIVFLENAERDPRYAPLMALRAAVYGHLRRVATRGWSFWDVASFREKMASLKST